MASSALVRRVGARLFGLEMEPLARVGPPSIAEYGLAHRVLAGLLGVELPQRVGYWGSTDSANKAKVPFKPTITRVYLVDGHELTREALELVLEFSDDIEVVGGSGRMTEARAEIARIRPDIAIMEANLPDGSGVELCGDVIRFSPGTSVIILAVDDRDETLFSAVEAGASGYLLKQNMRAGAIAAAVAAVSSGGSVIDPGLAVKLVDRVRQSDERTSDVADFSTRETKILTLIAEGWTNREIAARMHINEVSLKDDVANILLKLDALRRDSRWAQVAMALVDQRLGA